MAKAKEMKLACNVIEQVEAICDKHGNKPGELINILHEAQSMHGYLPEEMQRIIARKLNIPASKVYGVTQFRCALVQLAMCVAPRNCLRKSSVPSTSR